MNDAGITSGINGLTKPATVLIEKISNAIGVLYEPTKIKRLARAEVEAEKIRTIGSIELSEIERRGIERLVRQEARKQKNIESIAEGAINNLPESANPGNIDEDWIAHFFDKCDKISDEDMQKLWSNLLAGEATSPGKYSKRTVNCIAAMDKGDAELFKKLAQFNWIIGDAAPLIFNVQNEIYTKNGINFNTLKHLDTMGLISFEALSGYKRQGFGRNGLAIYFDRIMLLEFEKDSNNAMEIGHVLYTQVGRELLSICSAEPNYEYHEYAIREISNKRVKVSSIRGRKPKP